MSKTFCLAPWIHAFQAPNGERRLCCHAQEFSKESITWSKESSFEEYWNSEALKKIRLQMREGKAPQHECQACLSNEATLIRPLDSFNFARNRESQLLEETQNDGRFNGLPLSLDYRVRNSCNLSCRTCNPLFSSKIEQKTKNLTLLHDNFDKDAAQKATLEWRQIVKEAPIESCYFAGGEALIQPEHFKDLQILKETNEPKNIRLGYNTNLAFPLDNLLKRQSFYEDFHSVSLAVSIDGFGEVGEFIRDGLVWNRFYQNIEIAKKSSFLRLSQFDITLTLPTLIEIESLAQFLIDQEITYNLTQVLPGGYATLLSPLIIPKLDLSRLLNEKIEKLRSLNSSFLLPMISFLELILKTLSDEVPFSKEELISSYSVATAMDKNFERDGLASFYKRNEITKRAWENIEALYEEHIHQSLSEESLYWISILKERGYQREKTYIHAPLEQVPKSNSIVLTSYPSLLNKFLSSDHSKFETYDLLRAYPKQILGPFSYLCRRKPKLLSLARFVDGITRPVRRLLAFHVIIKI